MTPAPLQPADSPGLLLWRATLRWQRGVRYGHLHLIPEGDDAPTRPGHGDGPE